MKPYLIRFEVTEVSIQFENMKTRTYSEMLYDNWCLYTGIAFSHEYCYLKHVMTTEEELKEIKENLRIKYTEKVKGIITENINKHNNSNKFSRFIGLGTTKKIIGHGVKIEDTSISLENSTFDYLKDHFSFKNLLKFKETILEEIKE